jgi:hypothetical protein
MSPRLIKNEGFNAFNESIFASNEDAGNVETL